MQSYTTHDLYPNYMVSHYIMLLIHCFFLCGSVVLCYFVALASVYGNSVALLRAQLKLASSFDFFFFFN